MTQSLPSGANTGTTLGEKLGIVTVEVSPQRTVLKMPVSGNMQPAGILHGGATAALCEEAGSRGANEHALLTERIAVGTSLAITHVRAGREGLVTAVATAVHLGNTTTVHEIRVTSADGSLLSTAIMTNQLVKAR